MGGNMRVLLLGGGGREHAMAWHLDRGADVTSAPGNPGMAELGPVLPGLTITEPAAVAEAAANFDLVVVGPEAPLAAGVADAVGAAGVPVLGPSRAAARLESSKSFAKDVMRAAGVSTAAGESFTEATGALGMLRTMTPPYVVKADGLAAGKGVLVTDSRDEAEAWVHRCIDGGFGAAGRTVVVEEHLAGREVSVFALCSGDTVVPLAPARDYKRLGDGDTGPNTGGMGAYSPVDDLPGGLVDDVVDRVMRPVLAELAARGIAYRGFLYAGLMLTAAGPKVLEFNCRLGDPETQVVLPRLDADFATLAMATATGELTADRLAWHPTAAVDVVLAAPGYPTATRTGDPIDGVKKAADVPGVLVFHAGTALRDGTLVTAGGRVVNVVGTGPTRAAARECAYDAAALIEFDGRQQREDVAG